MQRTIAVWDKDFKAFVDNAVTSIPEEVSGYLLAFATKYGVQPERFEIMVTTTKDVLKPETHLFRLTGIGQWEVSV